MIMRPYRGWSTTRRDMERLRREMDRVFSDPPAWTGRNAAPSYPAMNAWTSEDSAIITAELPGVKSEDIDISVENELLTLKGTRQADMDGAGLTYHRRERRVGAFNRTFRLPFRVDATAVDAEFKNGVLSVVLPRAEEDKPWKIAVKAG